MQLLATPISRRRSLASLLGAGAVFIPAWNETLEADTTISCVPATPTVTEGPYWVDEKLFRSDVRTDPATGTARAGVPLALQINIQNLSGSSCTPLTGAYVDIWHCDAQGIYSDEASYNPGGGTGTVTTTGQKFLRGYQITDANGLVTFTTIYPGWYSGRTIHIHVRVRTYNGSTVLSNFVTQLFFDDSVTNTVLTQAAYSRTSARDTTNASDMIYNVANNTRMLVALTGSVANGYTAAITLGATFTVPAAATPAITAGGVANAVSGAAGTSPGTWISIYGSNLATATRALASSDLVSNAIPSSLGGVGVTINNKAAYVQYVSASQVNVLAPADSATGTVAVTLTNSAGMSNSVTTISSVVLPGLSVLNNYVRAIRYPDLAIVNGTGAAETGYTTAAAVAPGATIALYGTGFGPTSSTLDPSTVFTGAYPTSNPVTVTIGGVSAQVLFAGLVGPGLYQINVVVPLNLADGDQKVIATVLGVSSQSTALLKISAAAAVANAAFSRRRQISLLYARSGDSRVFLPLTHLKRIGIEHIMTLGNFLPPAQHPDAGFLEALQDSDPGLVRLA